MNSKNITSTKERKYKDTIFTMLFGKNKEALLSLYNALNHTSYENPDILEINTIESAIYMGIHNDVSFIIGDELNLYEHQASVNPNMPLRFLRYLSDIYKDYAKDKDIYSPNLIKLPAPRFVVFYNGTRVQKERYEYRISDAFIQKAESPQLELKVDVYNINPENNEGLKRACKLLGEYTTFVEMVRGKLDDIENSNCYKNLHNSLKESIDECIMNDILKDFLIMHKEEVLEMDWLYEFDEEIYEKISQKHWFENGKKAVIKNSLRNGHTPQQVSVFTGIPIDEVLDVQKEMLEEAKE